MKYFLHDSNAFNDEKITELFIKFGYEGLGLFYTALEKLAAQEKPIKTDVLKAQLRVGKKLEKCWKFMESLEILSSNNGETFNKQLLNFSEKYQIKKQKNADRIANFREKTDSVTHYKNVRNAPKVKVYKVKVNKYNNILSPEATEEKFSFSEKLKMMFEDKDRRMAIIAFYWTTKRWQFNTKEKYEPALRRELKPAGELKGYTNEEIKKTCNWLNTNADFKWTLETVAKYINEPLEEKNQKGGALSDEEYIQQLKENIYGKS